MSVEHLTEKERVCPVCTVTPIKPGDSECAECGKTREPLAPEYCCRQFELEHHHGDIFRTDDERAWIVKQMCCLDDEKACGEVHYMFTLRFCPFCGASR